MSTDIETSCMIESHATNLHGCENPMPDISKEKWLGKVHFSNAWTLVAMANASWRGPCLCKPNQEGPRQALR